MLRRQPRQPARSTATHHHLQPVPTTRIAALLLSAATLTGALAAQLPREDPELPRTPASPFATSGVSFEASVDRSLVRWSDLDLAPTLPGGATVAVEQGTLPRQHAAGNDGSTFQPQPPALDEGVPVRGGSLGSLQISFEGLGSDATDRIPPDTTIAVGPRHVVAAINRGVAIYSKLGHLEQGYVTLRTIFADVIPATFDETLFDPRLIWSEEHERYVLFALGRDEDTQEAYGFLAVSSSNNPHDPWSTDRIALTATHDDAWWDYASLGVDAFGIHLTGNLFFWTPDDPFVFKDAIVVTFGTSILTGGTLGAGVLFDDLEWPGGAKAFGLQVAHPHSVNGNDETFLLNTYSGNGSAVLMWKLNHSGATPTLSQVEIDTESYLFPGELVRQDDTSDRIDGGDARVQNVIYANRRLYATWGTDPVADGDEAGSFLLHLHTDNDTNLWDDVEWVSNRYDFYPAITVPGGSANGPAFVFSSTSSSTSYASSVMRALPNWGTNTGTLSSTTRSGSGDYFNTGSGTSNRWGDYSAATWDFDCDMAWGASQFAASASDRTAWGTMVSAHRGNSDPDCTIVDLLEPEGQSLTAGQTVTIDWDVFNIDGSGAWTVFRSIDGGIPIPITNGIPQGITSYSWDVPNIDSDDVVFSVTLFDGFIAVASGSAQLPTSIAGLPDYVPTSAEVPPAAAPGSTVEIQVSITNDAPVQAPAVDAELRLSTNDICSAGDTLIDSFQLSPLAAGATQALQRNVTLPATPTGDLFLCVLVDRVGVVTEFDEDNSLAVPMVISDSVIFADSFGSADTSAWSSVVGE